MWLRHLLSIALLPFSVAVLVPLWIARRYGVEPGLGDGAFAWALQLVGVALLVLGLVFFAASLRRFASDGRGTLAPWDPPRALVVRGPYRYVPQPHDFPGWCSCCSASRSCCSPPRTPCGPRSSSC